MLELFSWQKEAFFWRPGEYYQEKKLDANRPVYIAFFYSWLRKCSSMTYGDIFKDCETSAKLMCYGVEFVIWN